MKPDLHFHCVDLKTLVEHVENQRRAGLRETRRKREIWTACIFALCLEQNENQRFLIGFPARGKPIPVTLDRILAGEIGELDDWDIVLVPDLGPENLSEREFHQCQLVSYCYQSNPSSQDIIEFLEEKKLKFSVGGDLRLVVHLEQAVAFDWVAIGAHLHMRRPKCPYSQVFMLAQTGTIDAPFWSCRQLYPLYLPLKDLDLKSAKSILADRPTYPTIRRL